MASSGATRTLRVIRLRWLVCRMTDLITAYCPVARSVKAHGRPAFVVENIVVDEVPTPNAVVVESRSDIGVDPVVRNQRSIVVPSALCIYCGAKCYASEITRGTIDRAPTGDVRRSGAEGQYAIGDYHAGTRNAYGRTAPVNHGQLIQCHTSRCCRVSRNPSGIYGEILHPDAGRAHADYHRVGAVEFPLGLRGPQDCVVLSLVHKRLTAS